MDGGRISQLLTAYYDPMYEYQMNNRVKAPLFRGTESEVTEYLLEAGAVYSPIGGVTA